MDPCKQVSFYQHCLKKKKKLFCFWYIFVSTMTVTSNNHIKKMQLIWQKITLRCNRHNFAKAIANQ